MAIGFGLNKRGSQGSGGADGSKKPKKASRSVFDDEDDSASDDSNAHGNNDARSNFNRKLAAEQAALRARAQKAMEDQQRGTSDSGKGNDALYDYDTHYESFSKGHHHSEQVQSSRDANRDKPKEKQKSRYIQNLMTKAKERQYEREIILERKIALEQSQEDQLPENQNKDKFITKSYKQKLQERQHWIDGEKKKNAVDERNDVTKKTGGAALMGFYGNLDKIGTGAGGSTVDEEGVSNIDIKSNSPHATDFAEKIQSQPQGHDRRTFKDNDSKASSSDRGRYERQHLDEDEEEDVHPSQVEEIEIDHEMSVQQKRIETMQKIFSARDRYLERRRLRMQEQ